MNVSFLNRMLDEIERLRARLSEEHASTCAMLRSDAACDCGHERQAVDLMLECNELRATIQQLMMMQRRSRLELARIDVALAESKAEIAALKKLLAAENENESETAPQKLVALA